MSRSAQSCAAEILEVIPLIMGAIRAEMRTSGTGEFSVPQFRALHFLSANEGASLSGLAEHLGLMLPAVSKIADALVAEKLVKRRMDAEDRRRITLALTAGGRERLRATHKIARGCLARRLAEMPEKECAAVTQTMHLLRPLFTTTKEKSQPVK